MDELVRVKELVQPHEILLVVDAMTGQDAVNVAEAFLAKVDFDGVILTKLDGDARGGAALSIKAVTGKPIKFAGVGEKLDDLEPFHPDRMASRILGMGDVLTLIEKAQEGYDQEKAQELEQKLRKQQFNLEDFLEQMQQLKKMGPLDQILGMIPGIGASKLKGLKVDDDQIKRIEAIIHSMTPEERRNPQILGASRKRRIAAGQRHLHPGRQPAAQAVPADAEDGQTDGEDVPQADGKDVPLPDVKIKCIMLERMPAFREARARSTGDGPDGPARWKGGRNFWQYGSGYAGWGRPRNPATASWWPIPAAPGTDASSRTWGSTTLGPTLP